MGGAARPGRCCGSGRSGRVSLSRSGSPNRACRRKSSLRTANAVFRLLRLSGCFVFQAASSFRLLRLSGCFVFQAASSFRLLRLSGCFGARCAPYGCRRRNPTNKVKCWVCQPNLHSATHSLHAPRQPINRMKKGYLNFRQPLRCRQARRFKSAGRRGCRSCARGWWTN